MRRTCGDRGNIEDRRGSSVRMRAIPGGIPQEQTETPGTLKHPDAP
jgi:hypothetical protein